MRTIVLAVLVLVVGCGAPEDDPYTCTSDGQACEKSPDGTVSHGQCRSYQGAPEAFTCCVGCWDAEIDFCQRGDGSLGLCGTQGEDCRAC